MDSSPPYSRTPEIPKKTSKILSTSSTPSKSSYDYGLEKLNISRQNKQLLNEIQQVSNKIKCMVKLDSQIKRRFSQEKYRQDSNYQKKCRNEIHRLEKNQFYLTQKKQIEEQRRKNLFDKQKRSHTIKQQQESMLREKVQYAKSLKTYKRHLDTLSQSNKEHFIKQKASLRSQRTEEVTKHKTRLNIFQIKTSESLKKSYEDRIAQEKQRYLHLLQQKQDLLKQEHLAFSQYSDALQKTLQTH